MGVIATFGFGFSIEKARRDLGYNPSVDLSEGIRRTVKHLQERG